MELSWLPEADTWNALIAELAASEGAAAFDLARAAAQLRLDPGKTNRLDRLLTDRYGTDLSPDPSTKTVRLALLASSTVSHLVPAIRIAGLRRGLWITVYEAPYGAYARELLDPASGLHRFAPDAILFALDTLHATSRIDRSAATTARACEPVLATMRDLWRRARDRFRCPIVQQTWLPVAMPLLGSNEHRDAGSAANAVAWLNHALRDAAAAEGIDLLALDAMGARYGLDAVHDPVWWLRAKQEVSPNAAPLYGDWLARILAARQGLSRKCLVLDLDNTLWGGVVGDDGVGGLVLGQGSAEGEAYLAFQHYARDLAARGVILAVVSKNDEANALEAFETHPEMVLKRSDIAVFLANWDDKAQNLRRVAATLKIGLDALVFADDNPFERNLVRAELAMVAVPELPDDPARYARCLADAGFFESVTVTSEDRARGGLYAANAARTVASAEAADLPTYLAGLEMRLLWKPFDEAGLARTVQLINKTNQFNLTTRRTSEDEVRTRMARKDCLCLQFRLVDRFGDNGMIGVVIAQEAGGGDCALETWLMSCRVLGRQVENAMLEVVAGEARRLDAERLIGLYRPTPKNGMVRDLYPRLGFAAQGGEADGETRFVLDLSAFEGASRFVTIEAG